MTTILDGYRLTIDSATAVTANGGTDANFNFDLTDLPINHCNRVSLVNIIVPQSYYLINEGQNYFTLIENASESICTIPIGTYSISQLTTALKSSLESASVIGGATFAAAVSFQTGKLTINAYSGATYTALRFEYTGSSNQPAAIERAGIAEALGFRNTTYPFVAGVLESQFFVNCTPETTLFLKSSLIQNNILGVITPTSFAFGSYVTWENPNLAVNSHPFNPDSRTLKYNFCIQNNYGETIDLHGVNVVFVLYFWQDQTYVQSDLLRDVRAELAALNLSKIQKVLFK